ncbi:MAG: AMP-dependent synthetase/ligase [Crocinitomicaceae bacterium]|jgi:long-chain acyl-CoA synthetase|nr:AMP-dependent synthetase/ligase [Crocinitomicaceae bacterium]MDP4761787.1 AMP-dependent synthetase/ligase [Crocinitomicaceae bacterium]
MITAERLFEVPDHQLKNYPNANMFVTKTAGIWVPISTSDFIDRTMIVARGLISMGVQAGDRIAVASSNRLEWNILDIAVQKTGAILVPLYPNISESDYRFILNDCSAKICLVSNQELADKISNIRADVPTLEHLFSFDKLSSVPHWSYIEEQKTHSEEDQVRERMRNVKNEDLVTIIYTSGTTGNPKGVMLSHQNLLSNVAACIEPIPADNQSRVLTFLPICHVYERMLHYLYMYLGCSIYFAESMDTIGENIKEVKPDVFSAVPRLIEKVFDKILAKGDELTGIKRGLFFWALDLAEHYDNVQSTTGYKIKLAIARKLIFSKWQEALGGNVKAIASGSAALQPRLARIFLAANIPILEGYGLTETSPVVTVNNFVTGIRIGTVGALIEGVQVKIAEDGEILVKGPNVMMGYYNQPEATNEVIDAEGWFHTGDIGEFQEGKYLKITDRKKEIFKTSGGKYIVPQAMENRFKESRFIEQIMVIGEGEKFPAAFVVPNFAFAKEWAHRHGHEFDGLSNEEIIKQTVFVERINLEIAEINQGFGNWEQVKKIALLPTEFSIVGGELTPTLKLKRKKILEKYQEGYDKLFR